MRRKKYIKINRKHFADCKTTFEMKFKPYRKQILRAAVGNTQYRIELCKVENDRYYVLE